MKRISLTHHNTDEVAAAATEFLQEGGIVVLPMDTSYGIAVDATNPKATADLFALKGRDSAQPSSMVVADLEEAERYLEISNTARQFWLKMLPGLLTVVLPPRNPTAWPLEMVGKTGVSVRQPDHALTQAIAERCAVPFTATSANVSGQSPAVSLDEFLEQLDEDGVLPHLVIDGGTVPFSRPSTVVDLTTTPATILRAGAIDEADIRAALQ